MGINVYHAWMLNMSTLTNFLQELNECMAHVNSYVKYLTHKIRKIGHLCIRLCEYFEVYLYIRHKFNANPDIIQCVHETTSSLWICKTALKSWHLQLMLPVCQLTIRFVKDETISLRQCKFVSIFKNCVLCSIRNFYRR